MKSTDSLSHIWSIAHECLFCLQLVDLRRPPVSIEEQERSDEAVLKGILGQIVGQSAAEQTARLDAATKNATDLSAFVKRKPAGDQSSQKPDTSNKRSVEHSAQSNDAKRMRVSGSDVDKP